ncbi:MAG TPA: DUF4276 family protein [Tepidisphaeraceae bacterium]|jgi:hypothetical protein|nr:DUF4276 family protein [Tepidisphaeraceae bacterium]
MIAVLAEDKSDADTLVVIIRALLGNGIKIAHKGFHGCGELCKKGAVHIELFKAKGAKKFIVCHDSDRSIPSEVETKVRREIIIPSGVNADACIVVPVQEIEAWIIADEKAISRVIPSFQLNPVAHPETRESPKEWLENQSRVRTVRPLYSHAVHNPRVAAHMDYEKVAMKCPSFRPLMAFVRACA